MNCKYLHRYIYFVARNITQTNTGNKGGSVASGGQPYQDNEGYISFHMYMYTPVTAKSVSLIQKINMSTHNTTKIVPIIS